MVVIGIDFGNGSCVVSVWRNGRIDIVTNESNGRYTPSVVAFDERMRLFGVSAKKQWATNPSNTIVDFKGVLDVNKMRKWKFDMCNFTKNKRDSTLSYNAQFMGENLSLSPCQVLSMLFVKIKAEAQAFLQTNERILGCVIAVPAHFNDQERKGVLMAAAIARLDCHFLIKDTTAVAINYSLYKKFAKPITVVFIDFGQFSIQIFGCKFFERRLEMTEEISERIGGRDIDENIAVHLNRSYQICGANSRDKEFYSQLLYESEKLKKKMCSSVQRHQLMNMKQLYSGDPIFMCRSDMDTVCATLYAKIESFMRTFLRTTNLQLDEIHSIELVGGSSNIPIMQKLVENVFNQLPIATMNRDDAVARGCLLKSMLNKKRRGYKIMDRPFADAVNNFDGNFNERSMKDLVRVFQVHRFLKCDRRDSFQITEAEFMGCSEMERKLAKYDVEEGKRRKARDDLNKYISEHMKPSGVLDNCSEAIRNEINKTRVWMYGTKEQYEDLIYYWQQKVEKMNKKQVMRQVEEESVNDADCVTIDVSTHSLVNRCSSIFVKRITFSDCDEVTLIESNRSSGANSEGGSRVHRRGFPSRFRRLKRKANPSHDAVLANVGQPKTLLCGQRGKGVPWCCFL